MSVTVVDCSVEISPSKLKYVASPFVPGDCEAFDITLPPKGTPIGLIFTTDDDYLALFLIWVDPDKPVFFSRYRYIIISVRVRSRRFILINLPLVSERAIFSTISRLDPGVPFQPDSVK